MGAWGDGWSGEQQGEGSDGNMGASVAGSGGERQADVRIDSGERKGVADGDEATPIPFPFFFSRFPLSFFFRFFSHNN